MENLILFEDGDMVVAVKPLGMPTQEDKTGDPDFMTLLQEVCGCPLFLVHRLDRPVGGVMVFAKNQQAAAALSKQMAENKLVKKYLAVLWGVLPEKEGTLENYLKKNSRTNLSEVVSEKDKKGKKAVLKYRVLETMEVEGGLSSLAEITLETGRHHQIRVQTAFAGAPIWGDKKYNPFFLKKGATEIALWSYSLSGENLKNHKPWQFEAMPEKMPFCSFLKKS